jgi:hypothetical protein
MTMKTAEKRKRSATVWTGGNLVLRLSGAVKANIGQSDWKPEESSENIVGVIDF